MVAHRGLQTVMVLPSTARSAKSFPTKGSRSCLEGAVAGEVPDNRIHPQRRNRSSQFFRHRRGDLGAGAGAVAEREAEFAFTVGDIHAGAAKTDGADSPRESMNPREDAGPRTLARLERRRAEGVACAATTSATAAMVEDACAGPRRSRRFAPESRRRKARPRLHQGGSRAPRSSRGNGRPSPCARRELDRPAPHRCPSLRGYRQRRSSAR